MAWYEDKIKRAKQGQIVRLRGFLVRVEGKDTLALAKLIET